MGAFLIWVGYRESLDVILIAESMILLAIGCAVRKNRSPKNGKFVGYIQFRFFIGGRGDGTAAFVHSAAL